MIFDSNAEFINSLLSDPKFQLLFFVLSVWTLIWKGIALWKAAQGNQRNWFIAILVINTFGILEIVYIFYFAKMKGLKNPDSGKIEANN